MNCVVMGSTERRSLFGWIFVERREGEGDFGVGGRTSSPSSSMMEIARKRDFETGEGGVEDDEEQEE